MLSKENTGEQVTDNQSRLIRMQKEDILLSSSQQILQLPEGFTREGAIGKGDCFFDAVAQGLKQLKPEMNFTVKSLREVCKKKALSSQEMKEKIIADARNSEDPTIALPEPDIDEDKLWNAYLASIEYTAEDTERMEIQEPHLYESLTNLKCGSTLQIPVWGRPEIEGRMICNEYNVKLHIIEYLPMCGWSDQFVDGLASRSIDYVDYSEENTIHIINKGGGHFEPILRKTVQQILPHCYDTMVSEKKSDSKSVYFQQVSENEMTDNQMDWEISSTNVEVSHAESTIVDYENRLSSEELQYKQSQGNPIRSRVESSSSTSKDISDSVWYSALTDCRSTVDDVGLTDDEITKKATLFVKTFVKEFEKKLSEYSKEAKPGSKVRKTGKVVAKVASAVSNYIAPGMGRVGTSQVMECASSISANQHRKKAKIFSTIVAPSEGNSRKILIEAGLEIFQNFGRQFIGVTDAVGSSWRRGIEKLAIDAVSRVKNYISANVEKEEFSVDLITRGVVLGKSRKVYKVKVLDKERDVVLITSELYKNVGIKKAEDKTVNYYQYDSEECSCVEIYGYRLPFKWELERWEEVKQKYVLSETPKKEYVYIFDKGKKEELAINILKEINGEDHVQRKDIENVKEHLGKQDENMCQFSFNFGEIPKVFIKRKEVLEELTIGLHSKSQEVEMSRMVLISGEPGVGKSELARGYGFHERRYGTWIKIMWMDASSHSKLSSSFCDLAKKLKISIRDGKKRRIESIVKDTYKYLQDTKSFFVFDNASNYKEIKKFLPSNFPFPTNKEKPFILITSRNMGWKEEIEEIKLGDFTSKEAEEFVQKSLKIPESQNDSIAELVKELGYSPLNLTEATTYIKQAGLSISKYLEQCKATQQSKPDLLEVQGANKKLFKVLKINIDKITEEKNIGWQAYTILVSMAYLDPNQINTAEFFFQGKSKRDQKKVFYALDLLNKFSLIELEEGVAKIHEEIQKMIRSEQKKEETEEETLRKIMASLADNGITNVSHIISAWNYASKYSSLVNKFIESDYDGSNILHLLAEDGNEEVIRDILNNIDSKKLSKIVNAVDKWKDTPLDLAIMYGHLWITKYFIKKGAKLRTDGDFTSLHWAVLYGQVEVVKHFIDNKHFQLGWVYENSNTILYNAIETGQLDIVKYLVEKGICIDIQDENDMSPLHYAVENGYLDIIEYLIEKGARIDLQDENDMSPLHYAAKDGNSDIVKCLVGKGAHIDLQDENDMSPLHYAVENGYLDIIEYLIEKGARIDLQDENDMSPLHYAAKDGSSDIVKCLIRKGAKVNLLDKSDMSPLYYATVYGCLDVVEYLIIQGAIIDPRNKDGMSPLHYATIYGYSGITEYLVGKGANVNLQDKDYMSPLHYAAIYDYLGIVEYLVGKGAKVNLQNKDGMSPLHFVAIYGYPGIINYLVMQGSDMNLKDNNNNTPLDYAAIAKSLFSLEQGANVNPKYKDLLYHYAIDYSGTIRYPEVQLHKRCQKGSTYLSGSKKRKSEDISVTSRENALNIQLLQDAMSYDVKKSLIELKNQLGHYVPRGSSDNMTPIFSLNSIAVESANNKSLRR